MRPSKLLLAAAITAAFGLAHGQASSDTFVTSPPPGPNQQSDQRYLKRIDARFSGFAGSSANLESLAVGLRHGSEIQLSGSGEKLSFTSPTRPMGYGNITRALDLAMRDLAAAGIKDPTPSQIQAALMGGTVRTATGDVTFSGVLQLRSQGMGWGQIAHTIGVQPGLGSGKPTPTPAPVTSSSSGITTAAGTSAAVPGTRAAHGAQQSAQSPGQSGAITNAAGGAASSSAAALHPSKGQANGNAFGKSAGRI